MPTRPTSGVDVVAAADEIDAELFGDRWTGPGTYEIVKAGKAYNAAGNYRVYAAPRVRAPDWEETLFWRIDGAGPGGGPVYGDLMAREYTDRGMGATIARRLISSARRWRATKVVRSSSTSHPGRRAVSATRCFTGNGLIDRDVVGVAVGDLPLTPLLRGGRCA